MSTQTQSIAPYEARRMTVRDYLEKTLPRIAEVATRHLEPGRALRVLLAAASRSPALLDCTPQSLALCLIQGVALGLEVNGALGQAYAVPFRNKRESTVEATFIVGYRGYIELARRGGRTQFIEARVIREADTWDYDPGRIARPVKHRPKLRLEAKDDSPVIAAYALAPVGEGVIQHHFSDLLEIQQARGRSRARDSGPWVDDYESMARKTPVRRLAPYLPLSVEMATALEVDDRNERGEGVGDLIRVNLPAERVMAQVAADLDGGGNGTRAAEMAARLRAGRPPEAPEGEPARDEPAAAASSPAARPPASAPVAGATSPATASTGTAPASRPNEAQVAAERRQAEEMAAGKARDEEGEGAEGAEGEAKKSNDPHPAWPVPTCPRCKGPGRRARKVGWAFVCQDDTCGGEPTRCYYNRASEEQFATIRRLRERLGLDVPAFVSWVSSDFGMPADFKAWTAQDGATSIGALEKASAASEPPPAPGSES